ncbi:MAG: alpha/beta hydrolase [Microbacteriaceae bacterium]
MKLLPGVSNRTLTTQRLSVNILEREADQGKSFSDENTIIFVHGNVSSSQFWMELFPLFPETIRPIAIDLRGFGGTESLPVDASRGVSDYSDDVHAALQVLGIEKPHLVGWSLGGGVVMQYALDYPTASLTLQAPVSPYGFGGTDAAGKILTADAAGTGAGGANPDFIARLANGDTSADEQTSPRSVFRNAYVSPGYQTVHEDIWVESMLSTVTGEGNYPGNLIPSENWPGFAAGTTGNLNTLAPGNFNVSGIVRLEKKPPILWIRGDLDAIVGNASYFDINFLGQVGIIPGWPGEEIAPAQPMLDQTRKVLEDYQERGGSYREVIFVGAGHSPHLEDPERFVQEVRAHTQQ